MALLYWCGALLSTRWGTGPLLLGVAGAVAVQLTPGRAVAAGRPGLGDQALVPEGDLEVVGVVATLRASSSSITPSRSRAMRCWSKVCMP
jgi:hypothetical protein